MIHDRKIRDMFEQSPIIAAVKSNELLEKALESDSSVVFVLHGSICTVGSIVRRIKEAGKTAIVHVDLIGGLGSKDPVSVDFIREQTSADGIISTKQNMVKRAKELGLIAGERTFIVDSMALENCRNQLSSGIRPDFLEVLPGLLFDIIADLHALSDVPVIAGGLIREKADILTALRRGASAISTTKAELWSL